MTKSCKFIKKKHNLKKILSGQQFYKGYKFTSNCCDFAKMLNKSCAKQFAFSV